MGDLYIATKPVTGPGEIGLQEHLYLVYDPQSDFDPNNQATLNNDLIIRGGPEGAFAFGIDPIQIELGRRMNLKGS